MEWEKKPIKQTAAMAFFFQCTLIHMLKITICPIFHWLGIKIWGHEWPLKLKTFTKLWDKFKSRRYFDIGDVDLIVESCEMCFRYVHVVKQQVQKEWTKFETHSYNPSWIDVEWLFVPCCYEQLFSTLFQRKFQRKFQRILLLKRRMHDLSYLMLNFWLITLYYVVSHINILTAIK